MKKAGIFMILMFLIWAAFWIAVVYCGWHFVHKFW